MRRRIKDTPEEQEARFRRIVAGIKDFGYSNVTDEEVRQALQNIKDGKEPETVLEMFIVKVAKQRKYYD